MVCKTKSPRALGRILANLDRLGDLAESRKVIAAQEDVLKSQIQGFMVEAELVDLQAERFAAKLIRNPSIKINAAKFERLVGHKEFLDAVSIKLSAARELIGERELRGVADEWTETVQLRVTKRKHVA
jgi:hypothetical protein